MLLKDVSGKELRFDGTEWQDLGVNGHITNYIDEYSGGQFSLDNGLKLLFSRGHCTR